MKAYSPTGSPIVATADMIPGNANVNGFTRAADGSLEPEYEGYTEVCWDGQRPQQRGGLYESGPNMLAALKLAAPFLKSLAELCEGKGGDLIPLGEAIAATDMAIAAAEAPGQDLYVDENGEEWTEAELTFVADGVDPPAPAFATAMQPEK